MLLDDGWLYGARAKTLPLITLMKWMNADFYRYSSRGQFSKFVP